MNAMKVISPFRHVNGSCFIWLLCIWKTWQSAALCFCRTVKFLFYQICCSFYRFWKVQCWCLKSLNSSLSELLLHESTIMLKLIKSWKLLMDNFTLKAKWMTKTFLNWNYNRGNLQSRVRVRKSLIYLSL
jgi:hypothetical protein